MKRLLFFTLACLPAAAFAQNTVTVPWDEFRTLYTQQVEDAYKARHPGEQPAPLLMLSRAEYRLTLAETSVSGRVRLQGQVVQGQPEPLPLFGPEVAVTAIETQQGASLLSAADGYRLFVAGTEPFELAFTIAAPVREDQRSRYINFLTPTAVQNTLYVTTTGALRLLAAPGLAQGDGSYALVPGQPLELRFAAPDPTGMAAAPVIDTFTRIALAGAKYQATAYFVPSRPASAPLRLALGDARYLGSSLKPSWVERASDGQLILSLPSDWQEPFTLQYELADSAATLPLPRIADNQGREGEFLLEEPSEARLTPTADGLQQNIPASRLPESLRKTAAVSAAYARIPADSALQIALERFAAVAAPEIVLDTVHCYVSVTDNGNLLSVLRLELPAAAGRRLKLTPIPGAEIWSLTVNGKPQSLYSQSGREWLIPLAENGASVVELAYLQKSTRLGLSGRLDVAMPATGLAARRVNLAVALPERVELVALEGELEPAAGNNWPTVQGFNGRPYYFSYPFYRGDALSAAIYYKEPVAEGQGS